MTLSATQLSTERWADDGVSQPASFDFDVLRRCIEDLKANRAVHVPQYSFSTSLCR